VEVFLRTFKESDLEKIKQWIKDIVASDYMSRFFPKAFENGGDDNYLWFIIVVNTLDVGTIWVEKEKNNNEVGTLGIFLGVKEKLGLGIGQTAINQIIKISEKEWKLKVIKLNVRKNNQRAIKCYEHCGFFIVREDSKINANGQRIDFYEMVYYLG
jgi:RimJ/RimL family protein N-acetyltransferase